MAADPKIDTSVPHVARAYDYLLGGTANFAVDREQAEAASAVYPGGIEAGRANVQANREFLKRVVRHLAREAGVRQFLDIGSGLPTRENVHEVAQRATPGARVVYVDNDPIVLAHAEELLRETASGTTTFLWKDLRDPDGILADAAATLDLTEPVAVMLISLLHSVRDDDDPYGIVARLMDAVAPGSYLAISHMSSDITPETADLIRVLNQALAEPVVDRSQEQIARFLDGLDLLDPGVVQIDQWRPQGEAPAVPGGARPPWFGAVAAKP
jgi:hypothetical protein